MKVFLLSLCLLVLWIGAVITLPDITNLIASAVGGYFIGVCIYRLSKFLVGE